MDNKKEKPETNESGGQLDLIDFHPESSGEIIKAARAYKKYQAARIAAGNKEVTQKQKIVRLVRAEELQTLEDGKIKFELDNMVISIEPRDELVKVKDKAEES